VDSRGFRGTPSLDAESCHVGSSAAGGLSSVNSQSWRAFGWRPRGFGGGVATGRSTGLCAKAGIPPPSGGAGTFAAGVWGALMEVAVNVCDPRLIDE
jgi:hypothetical protein